MTTKDELLSRSCTVQGGTKVLNCVAHAHLSLTVRPTSCVLCATDVQNHLRTAISVNAWLNAWKDDAEQILRHD